MNCLEASSTAIEAYRKQFVARSVSGQKGDNCISKDDSWYYEAANNEDDALDASRADS
jgi:VCBS repeat-containing protein